MILTIAWRNLWRNRRRSIIILTSIVVGVVALIMNDSLSNGFVLQMLNNQIDSHVSHIQIHKNGFEGNKQVQAFIPDPEKVENVLKSNPHILHYSKRVGIFGLVSSAGTSEGATIQGIQPDKEPMVTKIKTMIKKGKYLTGKHGEILISEATSDKLGAAIGDKIVIMASAPDGSVANELFRIIGIFKSSSSEFDKMNVYISLGDAQKAFSLGNNFHEFAVITDNIKTVEQTKKEIKSKLGSNLEVLSYEDLLPLIMMYIKNYESFVFVFYLIIGLAVLFGVVNTMLMSVFERIQEFGILKAIGMKNGRIFLMVITEAFILGLLGTVVGLIVGLIIYFPLNAYGIDLSVFAKSLNSLGVSAINYPKLNFQILLNSLLVMPITAIAGAIYPAIKAVKLLPTDAMRYV